MFNDLYMCASVSGAHAQTFEPSEDTKRVRADTFEMVPGA
jgi:hypothetical protein